VDMVIMPSRAEGFGLTGLEALSAGLLVTVSKNSGFGEALGKITFCSGFVVDTDHPSSWEASIKITIVFFADGRIFPCFGGEHMASEYARYMFVDEFKLGSVHLL